MNPYIGEPHDVLARIHHEELVARAEEIHLLRDLRRASRVERQARRRQRRAGLI
ncbi:hypothetical protein GCM10023169_33430 [Georgenia halophila]|uniref:DUF3263 domain-containing protein n=1 Tax=Georgenia halophila TaxID=620889 RepID=A0ABP8LIA2_9MICO